LEAVFQFVAESCAAPAMTVRLIVLPDAGEGVAVKVHVVPLPPRADKVPPVTLTAPRLNPVTLSVNVAVIDFVAALPGVGEVEDKVHPG